MNNDGPKAEFIFYLIMKFQFNAVKNVGYRQPYRLEFMLVKYWRIDFYIAWIIFDFRFGGSLIVADQ